MRILITAGGTREYIDPVRFISNASSGRMGFELARAAVKDGHKVTLITTVDCDLRLLNQAKIVKVESAAEMFEAVKKHFEKCDCLIMAAAVADYAPAQKSKVKIKKQKRDLVIKLKPTADILKWAGKNKKVKRGKGQRQIVVGFALEDKNLRQNAEKKLKEKNLDMIVANSLSAIGSSKSTVHIKTPDTLWIVIENETKAATARKIIHLMADHAWTK
ncbi:MAG: phosphopantothenoylcysteine decarboxylase [Sedimentisphaerales bacterium]|nr:phosphopantothenoylcysteine decarboxylase [Sedimentisphaerales bacterium]